MAENKQSQQPPIDFAGSTVKILRAFQPGDVVFIESDRPMHRDAMAHVSAELKRLLPEIRVVVLQGGLKVGGREESEPWTDLVMQWRGMLDGVPVDSPAYQVAQEMDKVLSDFKPGGSA